MTQTEWLRLVRADYWQETFIGTDREIVDLYYEADEAAYEQWHDDREHWMLNRHEVGSFLAWATELGGYSGGDPPVVIFDAASSDKAAFVDPEGIHLHPKLLEAWTLLHELAHFIDPRAGHSPRWAFIYVELVSAAIGSEAGALLRREFDSRELPCHW